MTTSAGYAVQLHGRGDEIRALKEAVSEIGGPENGAPEISIRPVLEVPE